MAGKTKTKNKRLTKAEIKARERLALQTLVNEGLLREIRQVPMPPERRRSERPPIEIEGEPVSSLIIRERR